MTSTVRLGGSFDGGVFGHGEPLGQRLFLVGVEGLGVEDFGESGALQAIVPGSRSRLTAGLGSRMGGGWHWDMAHLVLSFVSWGGGCAYSL